MSELDEVNKGQIKRYLIFLKGKRERHLKDLDLLLKDVKEDRCGESIYNQEDVFALLDDFYSMSKDLIRSELENFGNMSALYSADLYIQSQQISGMQLCGDVSSIEEEDRLMKISELADWAGTAPLPTKKIGNLASLGGGGGSPPGGGDQGARIESLSEENRTLNDRFFAMQKQVAELLKERSSLSSELQDIKEQFATVKSQLSQEAQSGTAVRDMEDQLQSARALLESKSSEVEKVKEDMNRRLIESNQFQDMKSILGKKNLQIKELKDKLRKYEPDDIVRED